MQHCWSTLLVGLHCTVPAAGQTRFSSVVIHDPSQVIIFVATSQGLDASAPHSLWEIRLGTVKNILSSIGFEDRRRRPSKLFYQQHYSALSNYLSRLHAAPWWRWSWDWPSLCGDTLSRSPSRDTRPWVKGDPGNVQVKQLQSKFLAGSALPSIFWCGKEEQLVSTQSHGSDNRPVSVAKTQLGSLYCVVDTGRKV